MTIFKSVAVLFVALFSAATFAGSSLSIKVDDPTFCMGQNEFGQCVTYFGDASACKNIEPCNTVQTAEFAQPVLNGSLTWCYGMNDLDQCVLFLGSRESCANVSPCIFHFQKLDSTQSLHLTK